LFAFRFGLSIQTKVKFVHFGEGFFDCAGGKTGDFIYRLTPVRFLKLKKFLADDEIYIYGRAVFKVFPPVNLNDSSDFDAVGEFAPEIVSGFGVESAGFAQNNTELAAFF